MTRAPVTASRTAAVRVSGSVTACTTSVWPASTTSAVDAPDHPVARTAVATSSAVRSPVSSETVDRAAGDQRGSP
jgi:hypothetical protein